MRVEGRRASFEVLGSLEEEGRDEHGDVRAVYRDTQCHRCKAWGHMVRECPWSPGVEKRGKGGPQGGKGGPRAARAARDGPRPSLPVPRGVTVHYWWRSVLKVSPVDNRVDDHRFLNELIETALCADGLTLVNLQCFEMVSRLLQFWEGVYSQQLRSEAFGDATDLWLDERSLFLGQRKSRGHALMAPSLEAWVAEKLAEESAVLKERRKGREEQMLARGLEPASSGGGAGRKGGREGQRKKGKDGGRANAPAAQGGGGGGRWAAFRLSLVHPRGAPQPLCFFCFGAPPCEAQFWSWRPPRGLRPIPRGAGLEVLLKRSAGAGLS